MKTSFSLLLLIGCLISYSQDSTITSDLRTGLGTSFLGSGDYLAVNLSGEYNFYHNLKRSSAISMIMGKSNDEGRSKTSYFQLNANTYYSPFKRKDTKDFRIGTGLTAYRINELTVFSERYENNILVDRDYRASSKGSLGISFLIEKSYKISNNSLLAWSIYTQSFFNGDLINGIAIKYGILR